MFHYIRDCQVYDRGGADNGGYLESLFVFYHFLRVAGWKNIWEIDGYENHIVDGDMEDVGIASWTSYLNGTISKDTTTKNMGYQGLKVVSTEANSGVRSADMTSIELSKNYQLRFWVLNNTGRSWTVEVNRPNDGIVTVGTISSSALWQEVLFTFTSDSSSTSGHWVRITDTGWASVDGTIYVDSMFVYRGYFESRTVQDYVGTTDGTITAPDQFSSASYSFSAATDIGRYIAVWDPTNLGNSGVYRISSESGGVATLDLRSGGTPTLTSQGSLSWRMFDIANAPYVYDPGDPATLYCGFGLESPHAEKWRIFFRSNWNTSGDYAWLDLWASPYDADFYVEDGVFYDYEVSTQDTKQKYEIGGSTRTTFSMRGKNPSIPDASNVRLYLMTDDDGSFIAPMIRANDGTYQNGLGGGFAGFTGADSYHTLRESFCVFFPTNVSIETKDDINFEDSGDGFAAHGAQCGDVGKGWMTRSTIMSLGSSTTSDESDWAQSNWRVNPYDSKWWFRKPKIARDYVGSLTNNPTEKEMDGVGHYHGPIDGEHFLTKDSNSYFQFVAGWYWEWWSGHTPLP